MSAVVVRNLPPALHQKLKQEAARHHRSMNREIIAILEREMGGPVPAEAPGAEVPSRPLTAAWVRETTREMRDRR